MNEAMLYETQAENKVRCNLCNHQCRIKEGKRGICGARENRSGKLNSLVYGKIIAEHIDPIEKKPLFNFLPGSRAFSIGTVGCNFHCKHCQNADISQYPHVHGGKVIGEDRTPEQIVNRAKATGCESIPYTYTEPTIFYEFAYDTAILAHREGIKNVFVSNGYMMDLPPTPVATLRRAREIGMDEGLRYGYQGNVPGEAGENTYCYACGAVVIERSGLGFIRNRLHGGKCPACGKTLDGVGM